MLPPVNLIDTTKGRYLLFASRDIISSHLYHNGQWEPLTVAIATALISSAKPVGGVVIDAGANQGAFTIPLARELPASISFHCFEVQRIIFYQLCGNVFVNRLQNVYTHQTALGDRVGAVQVPVPDYNEDINCGGVSVNENVRKLRNHQRTDINCTTFEEVDLRPLDVFSFEDVRLLKIDVEGMELEVLRGAHRMIETNNFPPVLFELWNEATMPAFVDQNQSVINHLIGLGYHVQRIGELGIAQFGGRPRIQFDFDATKGALKLSIVVPDAAT